jgi:hypothetical protein
MSEKRIAISKSQNPSYARAIVVGAVLMLAMVSSAGATLINLGAAAGYTELTVTGTLNINGGSGVYGNVGVASGVANGLTVSGSQSFITGEADLNTGATGTQITGNATVGSVVQNLATNAKLAQAVHDIENMSQFALSQTQTLLTISDATQTLSLSAGNYVFKINGDLTLNGGHVLTISAPVGTQIIFDITGKLTMTGNSEILLAGGLTSDDVFYNVQSNDSGNAVSLSPGYVQGVVYAANGGASIGPPTGAFTSNQVLAYGNIVTHSGGQVSGMSPVPEASTMVPLAGFVLFAGCAGLVRRRMARAKSEAERSAENLG